MLKLYGIHTVWLIGLINLNTKLPANDFMQQPMIKYTEVTQIIDTHYVSHAPRFFK